MKWREEENQLKLQLWQSPKQGREEGRERGGEGREIEIVYSEKVSSPAQIWPQGAEKKQNKVYVGVWVWVGRLDLVNKHFHWISGWSRPFLLLHFFYYFDVFRFTWTKLRQSSRRTKVHEKVTLGVAVQRRYLERNRNIQIPGRRDISRRGVWRWRWPWRPEWSVLERNSTRILKIDRKPPTGSSSSSWTYPSRATWVLSAGWRLSTGIVSFWETFI